MESRNSIQRNCSRALARYFLASVLVFLVSISSLSYQQKAVARPKQPAHDQAMKDEYVGSEECALCHPGIYERFSRTDMGRSMLKVDASLLRTIPSTALIFDEHLNRHFEQYARDGKLFQSEYELAADGKEVFRDAHQVEWIIGAGANGFGGIIRRGEYLFETPLSFYSNIHAWALSPGYQYADFGFSRPILPACIVCHSGRPQPVFDGNGRFRNPPFRQLAVGCENCHGPGQAHVAAASAETIVNPAKLTGWQADNICMGCHQTGDARVLRAGKQYSDSRAGNSLDDTFSIFMVPFGPQSPPKDDLLEHYLSMRLSKCYRQSEGKLKCISCHDPHTQPARTDASKYFREKCLACHNQQSCTLPVAKRQRTMPADDCIGCHMPKRDVKVISHSVLTNHRIVTTPEEPFPEMAFHMTAPDLPDLVHLSAPPGKRQAPSRLELLQAYRQVMLSHPEYRQRYWRLAKELGRTQPNNLFVLQGLADASLQTKILEGLQAAIQYLDRARAQGTTQPSDFEQLARMLLGTHQETRAIDALQQGIALIPYDAELYRLLARTYFSAQRQADGCRIAERARNLFPQDATFRELLRSCSN